MLRKTLIGGAAGLLLMGFVFGRDAISYVRTTAGWVKTSVRESVPVEFQIERARKMIDDLEPEVRRNKHLIVKEEVAVERLAEQVNRLEQKQTKEESNLKRMMSEVKSGEDFIYFAGHRYTTRQVKQDMANRFERFKTNDDTLVNLRKVLNGRQKALNAARVELEQMLAARNQLIAEVSKLEARQQMVQVAQSASEFDLDSSALARAKQLVRDVEARLDVTERLLSADIDFHAEIPLDGPASDDDITDRVAEYLGMLNPEVEQIAAEITAEPQL